MSDFESFTPSESAMRRALRRAGDGVTLNAVEAETLLHARGKNLETLLGAASRVRDAGLEKAGRPGVITYSRKVFIPLTHLCRDRCHYCTFVTTPGQLAKAGKAPFLSPDEVLEIARAGAGMGCKEALFTLGDRPENRWPVARAWLDAHGYDSTVDYLRAMAIRVLEETGLLPHLNPGVMSWEEIQRLKPVAPSMGMMLETTATRLWSEKGGPTTALRIRIPRCGCACSRMPAGPMCLSLPGCCWASGKTTPSGSTPCLRSGPVTVAMDTFRK
jgi:FO synthase